MTSKDAEKRNKKEVAAKDLTQMRIIALTSQILCAPCTVYQIFWYYYNMVIREKQPLTASHRRKPPCFSPRIVIVSNRNRGTRIESKSNKRENDGILQQEQKRNEGKAAGNGGGQRRKGTAEPAVEQKKKRHPRRSDADLIDTIYLRPRADKYARSR